MRCSSIFGKLSYGEMGNVYSYSGDWAEMTLNIVHHVELPPRVREALAKALVNALVEDFKQNPPNHID
jgi:hypothetical protein